MKGNAGSCSNMPLKERAVHEPRRPLSLLKGKSSKSKKYEGVVDE